MDLQRPKKTTDRINLVGIVQYYQEMLKCRFHFFHSQRKPFLETNIIEKYPKQSSLKFKKFSSEETLLNYPDWTISLTIHIDASDKHLGAVITQNNNIFHSQLNNLKSIIELYKNREGASTDSRMYQTVQINPA